MRVQPKSGGNSNAEDKVREKIKALTLSNSQHEIALWSLHVPKHEKKEFSETDFIIIARQGICCIEVKGGRVSYINGVFLFTNRYGNISQKKEGPIQQVAGNKKAIQTAIREDLNLYPCMAHCVVMPDCEWDRDNDELTYNGEPNLVLDINGYHDDPLWFENFIKKVFRQFREHRSYSRSKDLSDEELIKIQKYLRKRVVGIVPLLDTAKDTDKMIHAATEEQMDMISTIERNDRIVCNGPAGSGKTLIAVDMARNALDEGLTTCFLVRNRHFALYLRNLIGGSGIDILSIEEGFSSMKKYECVIVDEGQDLMTYDCLEKFENLLKLPIDQSKIYWFMDENNQSNLYADYENGVFEEYFKNYPFFQAQLVRNCRNPVEIIKETNAIAGTELIGTIEGYSEKTKHIKIKNDNKDKHANALIDVITDLYEKNIHPDDIAVISLTSRDESCVNHIPASHNNLFAEFNSSYHGMNKVKFFDVLGFKGQEARFVVLIDIYMDIDKSKLKNLFYTGLTRAKTAAVVIRNEKVDI
jgi:hypothetical protein